MNYIKEAENYLYYYNDLKVSIENMEKERDKLIQINGPKDISSVCLDETGIGGESKQDEAINVLYKLQEVTKNITKTKEKLDEIDKVLDSMDLIGADILRRWYIKKENKQDIAKVMKYSLSQVYRLKDKAVRTFAVQIHGIKALQSIC